MKRILFIAILSSLFSLFALGFLGNGKGNGNGNGQGNDTLLPTATFATTQPISTPTTAVSPTLAASPTLATTAPTGTATIAGGAGSVTVVGANPATQGNIKAGVIITLTPPLAISLGDKFTLAGSIRDWSGLAVANAGIQFSINGAYLGQTRSDNNGAFTQDFNRPFDAGIYAITATFNGTHNLSYASAATTLKVQPATVTVQTVPAVAGVTFELNNTQFITGDDGSASIRVNKAGVYRLQVLTDLYNDPNQRIQFGRWLEDIYLPYEDITVPTNGVIPAGLNIFNQVSESFIDLDGLPVPMSRITNFTVRSEQGDTFTFNNGDPRWIPSSRITRRVNGLIQTKMLYSVLSVKLDGSNVVNASQQQFYAEPNDNWKISLLLYSLQVKVSDGLFGTPVGKSINLLYPNGQNKAFPLDRTGSVEIHGLARGNYTVQIMGAKGLGNKMPVALSRNQSADMKILTYVDVGIIGFLGFVVAIAMLIYGRRQVFLKMLRNQQQPVTPHPQNALLDTNEILPADGKNAPPKDEVIKWS